MFYLTPEELEKVKQSDTNSILFLANKFGSWVSRLGQLLQELQGQRNDSPEAGPRQEI